MLTPRGWWFLILVLTVGGIGGVLSLRAAPALLLVSLTLLGWMGFEWMMFHVRARLTAATLAVEREVRDHRGTVATLWVGKTYRVRVTVRLPIGRLPYAALVDRLPVGAGIVGEPSRHEGLVSRDHPAIWEYAVRADRPGVVRFEGVRVVISDAQGFFYQESFLRGPVELAVLPTLADEGESRRSDKRINLLPPPGVHRHRRPGTGSELLELRDYRPGDPPKRIAWKVSARRDELITREYESEVPLRCTLILDASNATRLGPVGKTALADLSAVAGTVARTAIGNRDLVGLAVCSGPQAVTLAPARTSRQIISILETLSRTAPLAPVVPCDDVAAILPRALALAQELYPEMMRPNINRYPAWLPWWSPPPVHRGRRLFSWLARWRNVFSGPFRRRLAARKRLAALLAAKYDLPPGTTALLSEEDAACGMWLQHFLAEHRVPADVPVFDAAGRDRFATAGPVRDQTAALTRSVSRGRDNELYVLMGEYVERAGRLSPLLQAVRVARARHHQVIVVQPGRAPGDDLGPAPASGKVADLLAYAERCRQARLWRQVRRDFGRLGVPVVAAGQGDPARLILHRLEQLRNAQGVGRL